MSHPERFNAGSSMRKGFTLIELLTVASIIGIFSAMIVSALTDDRGRDRAAACANNLRQIGRAIEMYKQSNDGWFPSNEVHPYGTGATGGWTWREAIWSQVAPGTSIPSPVRTPEIYNCPSDEGLMQRVGDRDILPCSYNMNSHRFSHGALAFSDGIGRSVHYRKVDNKHVRVLNENNIPEKGTWWTHESWVEDPAGTILAVDGKTPYWSWRYYDAVHGPASLLPPAGEDASRHQQTISPQGPKHDGGYNFLFCDGSVRRHKLEDTVGNGKYDIENHRALGMWTKTRGD